MLESQSGLKKLSVPTSYKSFLEWAEPKEQIDWTDILLKKAFPDLHNFRTIIYENTPKEHATVYALSTARTFLTLRFFLPHPNQPLIVDKEAINKYTHQTITQLYRERKEQYSEAPINPKHVQDEFYSFAGMPKYLHNWLLDFIDADNELADLLLIPDDSYAYESTRYRDRGIVDIAYPMALAWKRQLSTRSPEPKLLPMKSQRTGS